MPSSPPSYDERLLVPWWWWPVGLGIAVMTAFEVDPGSAPLYLVLPALVLVGLALLSRLRIRVVDGVLHIPGARAPVATFGRVEVLDRQGLRLWLGARAQPDACVVVRPWVAGGIRASVVDPDDATPYWLLGTRDPARLAAALTSDPTSDPV